jgi:hypothetical protein
MACVTEAHHEGPSGEGASPGESALIVTLR